jgi:UDP-N-acetylmuramate: L-alanyl-gamma-D-glutamyl-meso-diaminopimelate ligase
MAIAAARHAGVPSQIAIEALGEFINTKRRLELRGTVNQIKVYDDFAHHPTAIAKTLAGVRAQVDSNNEQGRVIAVLEPRSNTMKSGVHKDTLPKSLAQADQVFVFQGEQVKWSVSELIDNCQQPCVVEDEIDQLVCQITNYAEAGDSIVVMSNGSFSSIHEKILKALAPLSEHYS